MSATQSRSGAGGAKLRHTRSRARSAARSGIVVRLTVPRTAPCSPAARIRRSTVQRATGMPSRLSWSHTFRGPVHRVVRGVDPADLLALIPLLTCGRGPPACS